MERLLTAGIDVSLPKVDPEQGVSERRQIPLLSLRRRQQALDDRDEEGPRTDGRFNQSEFRQVTIAGVAH